MEKRKVYKISIIDKEISRTEFDRNTFYTSDSELTLVFKLIERDYSYDHGEILLYNENDKSFVTRKIKKRENDFVYEIDSDIIPHYGTWKAQLQLVNDGDVYTSKHFDFSIVNDLSNLAPQPTLTDINNWATLKQSAAELIDEMQDIIVDVEKAEMIRQNQENSRVQSESERQSQERLRSQGESQRQNQENSRVQSESERRLKELERENSESNRQSIFENNEVRRKEKFNTNETTRQENETARQQAESQRQIDELVRIENEKQRVLTNDNMQDTFDMIGKVKFINLAPKSNFKNGLGEWKDNLNRMTINQKDGYIEMVVNSNNGRLEYSINDIPDDKFFMVAKIKSTSKISGIGSSGTRYFFYNNVNQWEVLSGYANPTYNNFSIIANEVGSIMQVEYAMLFNVTSIFGKGNEPTKEVMEWIIKENGYFDELTLRRDDIQQYEIDQLRKAVIALGGTI